MNPFEGPMIGADMLHGIMDKSIAKAERRTVMGREYQYFYNPMWSRMGDDFGRAAGYVFPLRWHV